MSEQLTKNFKRKELECKCGCGGCIEDELFLYNLQQLRNKFGPMPISSGYRCPDYNSKVSSTGETGPHTIAAVDVLVYGREAYRLIMLAMVNGWDGIGVNQKGKFNSRFIHLDRLYGANRPWVWTY